MKTMTLKVFAPRSQQAEAAGAGRIVEHYPSFVIVEARASTARAISLRWPCEDMASQYRIRLLGRDIDPLHPGRGSALSRRRAPTDSKPHHHVVQFIGPVKPGWIRQVERAGGQPRRSIGGLAYVVRATAAALARIDALHCVRWTGHLPHADRVASALARRAKLPPRLRLEVFEGVDLDAVASAAQQLGFGVLSIDEDALSLVVSAPRVAVGHKELTTLSAAHGVARIAPLTRAHTDNDVAARLVGVVAPGQPASGRRRLTGAGQVVAVCDTGLDSGDLARLHPDFAGRVKAIRSYPVNPVWASKRTPGGSDDGAADRDSGHGTHVAGSVLGGGAASQGRIRGMAPSAQLVFQAVEQEVQRTTDPSFEMIGFPNDLTPLLRFALRQGARIHNNSWSNGGRGNYDGNCRQIDRFVWQHKTFAIFVAAGNNGSDAAGRRGRGDGRINRGSISPPGTAKNCITVGASESLRPRMKQRTYASEYGTRDYPRAPFKNDAVADDPDQVAAFSGRGPTRDGRCKPDLVAPGTLILSTRSSVAGDGDAPYPPLRRRYTYMSGTSMATPIVAGTAALLREALRRDHGRARPTAALIKALLIAGCVRLPGSDGTLVDNDQGFGRIHLERSLARVLCLHEGRGLSSGRRARIALRVPRTQGSVRVVMAYTDPPGHRLVNNLNLFLVDPANAFHIGNRSVRSGGMLLLDSRNNVEVIQVDAPSAGAWWIDVVASNVPQGPQDFALAAVLV